MVTEVQTIGIRERQLRELATNSLHTIVLYQLPNGLIPATLGRSDDHHFGNNVWTKDNARAIQPPLDPNFQQAFPELADTAKQLSLSSIQALLRIQGHHEQRWRFQSRPVDQDHNGYSIIYDRFSPAIKFSAEGRVYQDWGHNQPDNWGTLLQTVGKAIELNWPVLETEDNPPLGEILQEIISYVVNLRTERLKCRSIWEREIGWSSYSTRRIVLAGLDQIEKVWPKLEEDSENKNYPLKTSHEQLKNAADSLRDKVTEHGLADYTDIVGHESTMDLAQLVVLNDIDLPEDEINEIIPRAYELECRQGFYRYHGDSWKHGRAEAKWTMGKPIMARHNFMQAISLYEENKPEAAFRALDHGLDRIAEIIAIKNECGYIPELFEDQGIDGYQPNNNQLAWTLGYTIRADAAGIIALSKAEQYYQMTA